MRKFLKIIYNAHIYTLDNNTPVATELLIDRGVIKEIGVNGQLVNKYINSCRREDRFNLKGKFIIPGLIDSHIHLKNYGQSLQIIDCETQSIEECLDRVSKRARVTQPGEWIIGHGWNHNNWGNKYGSREDLDYVAPENPVYLTAKSLHAAWVNSLALKLSGVDRSYEGFEGGEIVRDDAGNPTGILLESAMRIVADLVPQPSLDTIKKQIYQAQLNLWKMGITGVHDFDQSSCFQALQLLQKENKLHLRVVKSIPYNDLEHAISIGLRSGYGNDFLRIGALKLFSDGALGPRTAAMLSPYENDEQNKGILLLDSEELFEIGCRAVANGISLAVHAIGDRANHETLNAFAQLRDYEAGNNFYDLSQNKLDKIIVDSDTTKIPYRHRIEHVQLIHPDDIPRLEKLNIIASMQPIHATSDMYMADKYWGSRAENSYAWQSLQSDNALLAFGSDAPVESPNPFWGIHAAVTRKRRGEIEDAWYQFQSVSVEDAVRGYTTNAAYAGCIETKVGRLSAGMLADLVVLDYDIFNCNSDAIWEIEPAATMIGGDWVYQNIF